MRVANNRLALALVLSLTILNFSVQAGFSKDKPVDEDKTFTEVEQIAPQNSESIQNRTYDEGITVKNIEVTGNNLVKTGDILNNLTTKPGTKFDKDQIQKDLRKIYDMGYFNENIKATPEASSTGITLKIQVEENIPVTGFNITGNSVITSDELAKVFNSQTGLPQNISELNKAVQNIENMYAEKGYILARVKKITDDPDGVINIQINEGYIDDIKISGNTKTKDFVVKRNMAMTPGMVYNETLLKQDLTRIYGTQSFSDVRRVISASPKNPDKYLLTVEVDEKRTGSISLGGGVDTGYGLFGSLGYMDNNFRGLGQSLSATAMLGSGVAFLYNEMDMVRRANVQFETRFLEPNLKQTLNSLQLSCYGRELASYQVPLSIERRIGGSIEVARPIKKIPHLAGSVSMGVENVKIMEGSENAIINRFNELGLPISRRAEQLVGGTYISLGPSLVYDTRNSFLNPTDGWYGSIGFNENWMITGDADSYATVTGGIRKFFPVGKKSTFTIGGKVGAKAFGTVPEFAAFRLGGADTIRGFWEGDVGTGSGFMMASAEFRTPIPFIDKVTKIDFFRDIRTAFFLDAGTIFTDTLGNLLYDRPGNAISTGFGLRVNIPGVGPIRVDYGFPITSVGYENRKNGRLTFGFGERY